MDIVKVTVQRHVGIGVQRVLAARQRTALAAVTLVARHRRAAIGGNAVGELRAELDYVHVVSTHAEERVDSRNIPTVLSPRAQRHAATVGQCPSNRFFVRRPRSTTLGLPFVQHRLDGLG